MTHSAGTPPASTEVQDTPSGAACAHDSMRARRSSSEPPVRSTASSISCTALSASLTIAVPVRSKISRSCPSEFARSNDDLHVTVLEPSSPDQGAALLELYDRALP